MTDDLYRIGAVARQLDMTSPGLRKWCDEYADLLSDHATPEAGTSRRFTEEDVSTLLQIAKLRASGLNHDEIRLKLKKQAVEEAEEADRSKTIDEAAIAPLRPAPPADIDPVQHWLATTELQQPQQRTGATVAQLSLAFLAGVVVTFALLLLAVLFLVWLIPN